MNKDERRALVGCGAGCAHPRRVEGAGVVRVTSFIGGLRFAYPPYAPQMGVL
jgi:hypothetical protein